MSDPTDDTALSQLAFFWANQSDALKRIFNQLYDEAPEAVTRVLSNGQLVYDPSKATLDDVVARAPTGGADLPRVAIDSITIEPPYPAANEQFTITYTRYVTAPMPEHSDAVQIIDRNGQSVDERPDARPAVATSAQDTQTMTFEGLPLGEYTVSVWANLEGGDGSAVPTAQGMRGNAGIQLFVGDTAAAQTDQQTPAVAEVQSHLYDAVYALETLRASASDGTPSPTAEERFRTALQRAAATLNGVASLGDGFKAELDRIGRELDRELDWTRDQEAILPLQQRLNGLLATANPDSPGDLGFALIDIVDNLY